MLVDVRTYHVRPGTMQKQLKIYEDYGLFPQKRHLGEPLGFLITETGADINCYIHLWVYEDAADRTRKRAAMMADPDWQQYLHASSEAGYLIRQENRLMTPASFAPLT